MISEKTETQIKDSIDIVALIGDFISLKKQGVNYLGLCPFHDEKTPSFMVSLVKGIYKCFSCGVAGGGINFVMDHEKLTYPEALTYIAQKNNITMEYAAGHNAPSKDIYSLLTFAKEFYQKEFLVEGNPAAAYALARGIHTDKDFALGFASGGKTLYNAALKAGFTSDQLIEAGLAKRSDKGIYDYFISRLVFPYSDTMGRTIGFTGRSLREDSKYAKYFNSPETITFHKGKVLYGLVQAKAAIVSENDCILVEGQIDVISLHSKGIKNVVCSSGTAFTSDQIKKIRSFTNNITLLFDGDKAGKAAALKSIDLILAEGLDVWIVQLPDGTDPDSFCKDKSTDEILNFIEEGRHDFIDYHFALSDPNADNVAKTALIKEIAHSCSFISDEITRAGATKKMAEFFEFSYTAIDKAMKKTKPVMVQEEVYDGFFAFNDAKEAIKLQDEVYILLTNPEVITDHSNDKVNVIGLPVKPLSLQDISALSSCTKNIRVRSELNRSLIKDHDNPIIKLCLELLKHNFNILVLADVDLPLFGMVSFVDYYIASLVYNLSADGFSRDDKSNKVAIEKAAELISLLDSTSIQIKIPVAAKQFGTSATIFSKIIKPFLDKKKSKASQNSNEFRIDDQKKDFTMETIPDYVDMDFFHRYGFFPAENKAGKKIFYVFRTTDNVLSKVANFFIEPLFQVFDLDPNRNKRIVKLNHAELGTSEFVEMPSGGMMEFNSFKKFCWNQGGYVFSRGKSYHHEAILESMALAFPKCFEFSTFGWQPEGFFAFSNGIYARKTFIPVDDLGLVEYMNVTYYSPAFSKIFASQREDSDKYINDRFLVHKPVQETTWQKWCSLMDEVYKYHNNGKWAIVFTILAAHRSAIFPINRFFTSLFFVGPTDSGKTKIAESIRAPFMYGAPLFNLNSGTDAAFFTVMERYRDVPIIFEEYNDSQISDTKFQGLKAAVYDNEGKTKRKDAGTKELDISKVNGAPVNLGQDVPERDDGALANRCIICYVPKNDNWTQEEQEVYDDLKTREKAGLTNICLAIVSKRSKIVKHWSAMYNKVHATMKAGLTKENSVKQTRIMNTVCMMLTMVKFWEEHAQEYPLPFTYEEFYVEASTKIIKQSEDINKSNKLSLFFDALSMLLNKDKGILEGREFKIEVLKEVTVVRNNNEKEVVKFELPKRVIFLRLQDIHLMYKDLQKLEALKMSALKTYLEGHESYIGRCKSTRFEWQERGMVAGSGGILEQHVVTASTNTSSLMFDYDLIGVDLQKFKEESPIVQHFEVTPYTPGYQERMPY